MKHWLDFFGAPGLAAYEELEKKLSPETTMPADSNADGDDVAESVTEMEQNSTEAVDNDQPEEGDLADLDTVDATMTQPTVEEEAVPSQMDVSQEPETSEKAKSMNPSKETPEAFEIEKLKKQLALLDQNQAWLAARCIQLKDIEIYAYPFYGYLVDMMRQILKSIETVEKNEVMMSLLDELFEGGKAAFENKKQAIQHDIELAEQNCESATTALISEDMDMDEVKRTLGTIDESDTVEYVGPAPDGFELLDDETPLDETAIKKQYEKLENMDALTGDQTKEGENIAAEIEENASQKSQKGVQRKLSFSLKRKKPTEDAN